MFNEDSNNRQPLAITSSSSSSVKVEDVEILSTIEIDDRIPQRVKGFDDSSNASSETLNIEESCDTTNNSLSETSSVYINDALNIPEIDIIDLSELSEDNDENPSNILNGIRTKNVDRLIIAHLNINFIYQKFEALKSMISDKIDILMISETKLDESFPTQEFEIEGFSTPFRLDRNCHGGGILLYFRKDLPCKELKSHNLSTNIESIFIELTLRKTKWVLVGGYNPKKETISTFLSEMSKGLDKYICHYDNILLLGDFNSEMSDENMKDFCNMYNLKNLINEPTCYKSTTNPSSIDVMLTNRWSSFDNSTTIETGLSDHHKMIVSVLKMYIKKREPIKIKYRNYKDFDNNLFREELVNGLQNIDKTIMKYDDFKKCFMNVLESHAPLKSKTIRGNNAPFMNKTLSKAFMHRSRLKNKFNKEPCAINKDLYKKQRNFCVSLLKREKKNYYNNLDNSIFDDNRKFWQRIKPLFSDKGKTLPKDIILIKDDQIVSDREEIANTLNNFFVEAVANLEIESYRPAVTNNVENETNVDHIDNIIKKYELHPSILKIKENIISDHTFSFMDVTTIDFQNEISQLDPKKAGLDDDIPVKILKMSSDINSKFLCDIYNESKNLQDFPLSLKLSNVIPVHKAKEKTLSKNYRPISLLPVISKLFEKTMYKQIVSYVDKFLSPYLFGFRKGHSTEQCLLKMLEAWKKAADEKKFGGAILTDLSKAFDCLNHELLLAKLNAYGFEHSALKFINSYLKERKQRTKVGSSFSSWRDVIFGVPQGSILGPLLFNIFLNDIFFFTDKSTIANYADDNSVYSVNDTYEGLIKTLQSETNEILGWFQINEMKSNEDKCHLFIVNDDKASVQLGNEIISASTSIELLGISIDNKLDFKDYVSKLCKKGNQKLHALARVAKYLSKDKLRLLMRTFINSQFNYCPLIWMFHNRTLNNKINKLHERALRLVYKNDDLTFQELLRIDGSVTIHQKNLQRLAIEMFKVKNKISPLPVQEIFQEHVSSYDLREKRCWEISKARTVLYGTETIRFRGPKVWQMLPTNIKVSDTLQEFKSKVKHWKPDDCTCRLCKTYIHNLGFIDLIS